MSEEEQELMLAIAAFLLHRFPDPILGGHNNGATDRLEHAVDELQWADEKRTV